MSIAEGEVIFIILTFYTFKKVDKYLGVWWGRECGFWTGQKLMLTFQKNTGSKEKHFWTVSFL